MENSRMTSTRSLRFPRLLSALAIACCLSAPALAEPSRKQPVPASAYQPLDSPAPFPLQRSIYEKRKADSEQVRIEMGLKRLPVWEMSYAVWRPELAERFKLPPSPEGEQLPPQILGIEFYVEYMGFAGYTCNLQVFADEQLPFAYPFDLPAASDKVLAIGNRFFSFNRSAPGTEWNEGYLRLNPADRDLENRSSSVFLRSVYTASADFVPNKRGFQTSHTLTEFNRRLLPGIAYLNIRLLSCNYLMRGLNYPAATELWLERAGYWKSPRRGSGRSRHTTMSSARN